MGKTFQQMNFKTWLESVMYHGTSKENAAKIRQHGFDISMHGKRQRALHGDHHPLEPVGIYLTNDPTKGDFYGGNDYKRPGYPDGDVVTVKVDDSKIMSQDQWSDIKYKYTKDVSVWDNKKYHDAIQQAAAEVKRLGYIGIQDFPDEFVVFDPKYIEVIK